ncbi:hypothetical protein FIBSPDRAFT_884898 [Athelia psychrophila]|uniref:Uncharacterized protein n=1 Tax=Athelia psychrophila TaxID=1759441 RepID=A0A166SIA3_9AGAM|nr:hypothetical protein FIBSPDRAFT_884898 [Fibularhizoctonia sp. CBS 109695]
MANKQTLYACGTLAERIWAVLALLKAPSSLLYQITFARSSWNKVNAGKSIARIVRDFVPTYLTGTLNATQIQWLDKPNGEKVGRDRFLGLATGPTPEEADVDCVPVKSVGTGVWVARRTGTPDKWKIRQYLATSARTASYAPSVVRSLRITATRDGYYRRLAARIDDQPGPAGEDQKVVAPLTTSSRDGRDGSARRVALLHEMTEGAAAAVPVEAESPVVVEALVHAEVTRLWDSKTFVSSFDTPDGSPSGDCRRGCVDTACRAASHGVPLDGANPCMAYTIVAEVDALAVDAASSQRGVTGSNEGMDVSAAVVKAALTEAQTDAAEAAADAAVSVEYPRVGTVGVGVEPVQGQEIAARLAAHVPPLDGAAGPHEHAVPDAAAGVERGAGLDFANPKPPNINLIN